MTNMVHLLALQDHDNRIREIKKEIRDIPLRKAQETDRLSDHKNALSNAESTMKTRQATVKELELEIASRHEKINKLRQQQSTLKTNKEFKAIDNEIEVIQKEVLAIEERELRLMENVEAAKAGVAEKSQELAKEDAMVSVDTKSLDERANEVESELAMMIDARPALVKEIKPEWLVIYERVFTRKVPAVVRLNDSICGGCFMKLPPQVTQNVKKQTTPVCCDYCGRILY